MRNDIIKICNTWRSMYERCHKETAQAYLDYGGRGIVVCDEWHDPREFISWCLEVIDDSTGLQLDRVDNDGPYSPDNCRWVTPLQNNRNRRNSVKLTAWGETKHITEWLDDDKRVHQTISLSCLRSRIKMGWSPEDALTRPVSKDGRSSNNNFDIARGRLKNAVGSHENDPVITAFGESKAIWEWSQDARCRVSYKLLHSRLMTLGWEPEDAITKTPAKNVGIRYEGKTIRQWSMMPECEVSYNTLADRLKNGELPTDAMKKRKQTRA